MKAVVPMKVLIVLTCIHFFFRTELQALKSYYTTNYKLNEKLNNNVVNSGGSNSNNTNLILNPRQSLARIQNLQLENQKLKNELKLANDIIQQLRGGGGGTAVAADQQQQQQQQQQQVGGPPPPPIPPPGATTTLTNCALLFFGVPRIFRQVALPSIRHHLLEPNKGCDVFVHSYNITTLQVNRNGENGPLNPLDLYELSPNVMIESMESFQAKRQADIPFFQQQHHIGWGTFDSTANMIKAWHSIEGVWNMMEEYQRRQNNNKQYDRVGIFRLDMYYPHPIFIGDVSEHAIIPDFGWDNRKIRDNLPGGFLNDRGIYGDYKWTKIWATQRFPFVKEFAAKQRQQLQTGGVEGQQILFTNGLAGVHSESLLTVMVKQYQMPVVEKDICFWRLRAHGLVRSGDCGGHVHNYLQDEFNRKTLQGHRCQGPLFGSPPGPCIVQ